MKKQNHKTRQTIIFIQNIKKIINIKKYWV